MKWALLPLLALASGAAMAEDQTRSSCVDVKIENQQFYNCINERLAKAVPDKRTVAQPTYGVGAPANTLGLYTQAAGKERLGSNYGKSVVAQRPGPQSFARPSK